MQIFIEIFLEKGIKTIMTHLDPMIDTVDNSCPRAGMTTRAAPKHCTVHDSKVEVNGSTSIKTLA